MKTILLMLTLSMISLQAHAEKQWCHLNLVSTDGSTIAIDYQLTKGIYGGITASPIWFNVKGPSISSNVQVQVNLAQYTSLGSIPSEDVVHLKYDYDRARFTGTAPDGVNIVTNDRTARYELSVELDGRRFLNDSVNHTSRFQMNLLSHQAVDTCFSNNR